MKDKIKFTFYLECITLMRIFVETKRSTMATPRKLFTLELTLDFAGAVMGNIVLNCIAYLYADGTFKTMDINSALFHGNDVAAYVCAMQPEIWDQWMTAAEDHFKAENEQENELPADNYSDHERPSTL